LSELKNTNKKEVEKVLKRIKFEAKWEGCETEYQSLVDIVASAIRQKLEELADEDILEFTDEDLPEPDITIIVKTNTDEVVKSTWVVEVIRIGEELYDVWVEEYREYHWGEYKYSVEEVSLAPHGDLLQESANGENRVRG